MLSNRRSTAYVITLLLMLLLVPMPQVSADTTAEERLAERGLTLLALRNDTIDTNQDGDIDAVRVVVVLNSTAADNDLIIKLRGMHKERDVLETIEVSFEGQTNVSLVYDAWSAGEHELRLDSLMRTVIPSLPILFQPSFSSLHCKSHWSTSS
ncbi:hypothetical protein N9289_02365 [Candidatus Poseidonia sp.]|nr:hypothetical protein [Poseidonia sp.]